MFLQPQHFQQQDRYHETRLQRALQLLVPFCWGVKSLAINETALRTFLCEVERCELVTWDGTLLRLHDDALPGNARILPRTFEEALAPEGHPLGVYLGLRRLQWETNNLGMSHGGCNGAPAMQPRRYSLQEVRTPDLYSDDGPGETLHYLIHDVRLLFDTDLAQAQEYELVKIAELLRAPNGQGAVLSPHYIPPALAVRASPVLTSLLKAVRDQLTAKGRELAEYQRQCGNPPGALGPRETVALVMRQTLNRYIPLVQHYLEIEETHPCAFYALLRQLVGELSTFTETVPVPGSALPAYRHDQLWTCFDAAGRVLRSLLNALNPGPEFVVPLVFDGEYFVAQLEPQFLDGNKRYYLSVNVDMPSGALLHCLTETGKISPREEMMRLQRQALSGLRLDYLETPPAELPRRAHCRYFALDHHHPMWQCIVQRHNIAVCCALPPHETEMQVLGISAA
jgi:type VI secretion system protein ImpJ